MKVAVVTPYYTETLDTLRRCHDSVLAQTHSCAHIMVADGHARPEVATWNVDHIPLPASHGDYGNTPRSIGGMSALNRGFDAVAYLDADNWLHPDHISSLIEAIEREGAPLAFSDRFIVSVDGTLMKNLPEDDDPDHIDTNCILHTMEAARLIPIWAMMEPSLPIVGDKVFLGISRLMNLKHVRTGRKTIYYETNHGAHYRYNGLPLPGTVRELDPNERLKDYSERRCFERLGFALKLGA